MSGVREAHSFSESRIRLPVIVAPAGRNQSVVTGRLAGEASVQKVAAKAIGELRRP